MRLRNGAIVRTRDVDWAEELVDKALALEHEDRCRRTASGPGSSAFASVARLIAACERAITLNRNDSMAIVMLALFELQAGRADRAPRVIEQEMRLSAAIRILGSL